MRVPKKNIHWVEEEEVLRTEPLGALTIKGRQKINELIEGRKKEENQERFLCFGSKKGSEK